MSEFTRRKALLNELQGWLEDAKKRHYETKWKGVHDEGTFLTSWREYYLLTKDETLLDFARDRYEASYKWTQKKLKHGYWPAQEVHHGTEHFVIFLAWMLELFPKDEHVREQLRTAAHHIIEQGEKPEPWFDFETNRFRSTHLGTQYILEFDLNIVEHFRLVYMAWLGLAAGGDERLADFISIYCHEWAEVITNKSPLPVFLPRGEGKEDLEELFKEGVLQTFTGAAPQELTDTSRAELHIANGSPQLFFALYDHTKDSVYLDAVEKILTPLVHEVDSPYAHPVGPLLWQLHSRGRLPDLPQIVQNIQEKIDPLPSWDDIELELNTFVDWKSPQWQKYKNWVGMRADMPEVILLDSEENPIPPVHSTGTFSLLYQVTKQEQYLESAFEYARKVLTKARGIFPDGRKHGCGSRTISAACIGHGRNWGAGWVSVPLQASLQDSTGDFHLPILPKSALLK